MSVLNVDSVSVKFIVSAISPGTSISIGSVAGSTVGTTVVGQLITSGSGNNNTIVGYQGASGFTILTTGANNTILGAQTNVTSPTTTGGVGLGAFSTVETNAVAAGWSANASGNNSICMGFFSSATGTNSISVNGFTTSNNGISVGTSSQAGTDAIALGNNSIASTQSTSIGSLATCGSANSVCLGYSARLINGGGTQCTVIGSSAGSSNLRTANVLIGNSSGTTLTGIGSFWNTFVGSLSGNNMVTASSNVCVGYQSGVATGLGGTQTSVAVGYGSRLGTVGGPTPLFSLVMGYNSVCNGANDIYIGPNIGVTFPTGGSGNNIIGLQNGIPLTSGVNNVIIGTASAQSITTGSANIILANGVSAISTGNSNVLIGSAGNSITTASAYYGIGAGCWNNITTGAANGGIAIGAGSMSNATNAAANCVGLGLNAGSGVTSGIRNTCIGDSSGASIGAGSNNTCLGYQADVAGFSNCTALGNGASNFTASNQVVLGNGAITNVNAAVVVITNTSDMRDKKDISPLNVGLDFVNKIEPVSFVWNKRDKTRVDDPDIGFIAQDLLQIQKETGIVLPNLSDDTDPEHLMVTPCVLVPVLVQAIKDADMEISELENEIAVIMQKLGL